MATGWTHNKHEHFQPKATVRDSRELFGSLSGSHFSFCRFSVIWALSAAAKRVGRRLPSNVHRFEAAGLKNGFFLQLIPLSEPVACHVLLLIYSRLLTLSLTFQAHDHICIAHSHKCNDTIVRRFARYAAGWVQPA